MNLVGKNVWENDKILANQEIWQFKLSAGLANSVTILREVETPSKRSSVHMVNMLAKEKPLNSGKINFNSQQTFRAML